MILSGDEWLLLKIELRRSSFVHFVAPQDFTGDYPALRELLLFDP